MNSPSPKAVVGVDVGGTFTDLFWFDEAEKRFRVAKVPSQRGDEAKGFIAGLTTFGPVSSLASIVHGTTVGTNALLERKGAKVGVITTPGFRDVLEMRRRDRRQTWGLWGDFTPAASRENRLEVPERTLADGTIRTAVDLDAVREAARTLAAQGCEALAIIFINAYANPANERAALEAARAVWPNEHLACSSAILPEIREFERASTTALNATLQPLVGSYLGRLEAALAGDGFTGRFHIVQSNGGVMSTTTARKLPVRTALSGPAAGVIAAAAIARAAGFPDVITGDLGGTSFDVSLIAGGEAALAAQSTIDFGMVIRTPMIEITTIGAGGGSIARVDAGGLLEVGPESAGSRPGPVCYGGGNDRPTLTDANLVLGRIDGSKPLGTLQSLDVAAAREAIRLKIAEPLGLDVMTAAEAIVKIANARMAGAIRLVSIERGHDPAKFLAMPFGGGGALHAGALIKEVGLRGALVPRFPGVTSALGCVIADIRHDGVQTVNLMLDGLDASALDARMVEAGAEAHAIVSDAGLSVERIDVLYELDMHYLGQTHTVAVPLPVTLSEGRTGVTGAIIREAFDKAYGAAFSRLLPGIPVRIVTLRTAAIGRRPAFDLTALAPATGATLEAARRGSRQVYLEGQWRETAIWSRLDLPAGARIEGPAMLEQSDATILLDPGLTAEVDALGNLVILRS
ncbi:hydantoinase/oxoprolinase family protein [Bosea psychrotolerans]|uniref:N-methylhydantoinase A n=1 Tax=Bosea psychrotolerans TaxID=1871628 RepID=A0A2S4M609_9HYPH|nr:hydantoinase/oxoprolinase family protein [Bosea psychrotolerans]POR50057.1 N-methylhydantoinase A [Bosea psychrotolerans]